MIKKILSTALCCLLSVSAFSQEKILPLLNAKAYSDIDMNGFKMQNLDISNLNLLFTNGSSILMGDGSGGIANATIGSGLTFIGGTLAATASGGSVTDISVSDLSPVFTTSLSSSTTTPVITYDLSDAGAHSFLGNNTGSSAAPSYVQPAFTDLSGTATNSQVPSTISSKTLDNTNTATFKTNGFTLQNNSDTTKQSVFSNVNQGGSTTRTVNIAGGADSTTVVADTGSTHNFLQSISANGVIAKAQPAFSDISGTASAGQVPDLDSLTAPSADVSLNSHKITNLSSPSSANDAANKTYVDTAVASGAAPHPSVRVATTANITLSGAQTIDGVAVVATNRVLAKNQTSASQNGIYVAAAGSWARATDMDDGTEVPGSIFVSLGSTQAGTSWATTTAQPITIDTDPIAFTQTSGTTQYTAGPGLQLVGTQFSAVGTTNRISISTGIDISASYVGQSSITTLGTIGTGTWNGSLIGGTYGGTGVNNGSNTLTLGGNLATSGASSLTLTTTGSTNVTLPTSGILSTLSGFESLTNKIIDQTSFIGILDSGFLIEKSGSTLNQIQFSLNNLSGNTTKTITVPNANSVTVAPDAGASHQFLTGIPNTGVPTKAQPVFSDISGTVSTTQMGVGSVVQAWDADLDSLSLIGGSNTMAYRSGINTWSPVTVGSGLTFSGGILAATGGGGGGVTAIGATIIVDSVNGNDSTGTRGSNKPFLTVGAACAVALSGDVVIVGPGSYTQNTGLTFPAGVRIAGMGKSVTSISSSLSDATHAAFRWSTGTTISGITLSSTGANSPTLGLLSADTAATNCTLIDVKILGLNSAIKIDKSGVSSLTAYNLTCVSGAGSGNTDCINSTSGSNTLEIWNFDLSVNGDGTTSAGLRAVLAGAGATINLHNGKISTSGAGSAGDNVGLRTSGGIITAQSVIIGRDGSGGATLAETHNSSGTILIDAVVKASGGAIATSGSVTNLKQDRVTTHQDPTDPTGTTDATGKMMGLGVSFTPTSLYSKKVLIVVSGTIFNASGIGDGASAQIRFGTGTAPANGAALTGTATGTKVQYISSTTAGKVPFSCNAIISSLSGGTAYWIDIGVAAITGGTAQVSDVAISAYEL